MWFLRRKPASADKKFGFAVVGLGHIAGYFLDALRDSPTCQVTALVSGDAAKATAWAKRYGVARTLTYADFPQLASDSAVDAVYLALPVLQHREFTALAAAAGKHVLCEKPMAATSADAQAMMAACAAAGVKLSIAYRCPYSPLHKRLRHLVRTGALGPAASLRLHGAFGFRLEDDWREDVALGGGGSLYDVGIYPLNTARYLLGEEPAGVRDARATWDQRGLERSIVWTSTFPSGAEARCESSYEKHIADTLRVTGEYGSLLLAPAFSHRERYRLRGQVRGTAGRLDIDERVPRGTASEFRLEAEELAAAVRENRETETPGTVGLADMLAMEAIYREAGVLTGEQS